MNLDGILEIAGVTDVGRHRTHNEDNIGTDASLGLVLLADGMGGLSHGREVAEIAVNSFIEYIFHQNFKDNIDSKLVLNYMDQGFTLANEKVIQFAKKNNTKSGTTLTAALLINDNLFFIKLILFAI